MLAEGGITKTDQVVVRIIKYQPDRLNAVLAAGTAQEAVELYNDVRCLPWTATRLNVRQDFGIVIDGGSLPIVIASRAQFLRAWCQGRQPHVLKVPRDASIMTVKHEVGVWQAVMDTWAATQGDADMAGVSTPPGVVGPLTRVPFSPGQHSAGKGRPVLMSAGVLMPMYAGTLEDAQIAHCDVKASNVFVDFRGEFHLDVAVTVPLEQLSVIRAEVAGLEAAASVLCEGSKGVVSLQMAITLAGERLATVEGRQCIPERIISPKARVLSTPSLCEHILSYVGRGEWAFIAAVSKTMRAAYMVTTVAAAHDDAKRRKSQLLEPALFKTAGAAAVTSAARLEYALDLGLGASHQSRRALWTTATCVAAGATGDMRVVTRAHEAGMPLNEDVLLGAASTADVGVLATLERRITQAIKRSNISILMWLLSTGAAVFGQEPFHADGTPVIRKTPSFFQNNSERDLFLESVQTMAGDEGGPVHTLLDQAVGHGRRAVVEHLHSLPGSPYKFTHRTTELAAERGHVPLLHWMYQQGAPFNVTNVAHAAMCAKQPRRTLKWLSETRMLTKHFLSGDVGASLLLRALERRKYLTAAWLLHMDAPWTGDLGACAANGSLFATAAVWAAEHKIPWGSWTDASVAVAEDEES
ncbi:hypothetical protein JKP88DRAFT_278344 [Tribonema minus]|uniref:Uncharacterized protein n=1 Tax=Tribonema minus TaxID=303371 RepID=A0A836CDV3_9STRA|nr:hypothetical protein JKP88DRAFT_278344 [Tribonema minus]